MEGSEEYWLTVIKAKLFFVSDVGLHDENKAESVRRVCAQGRSNQVTEERQ
jgi:hypothetical protein